MANRAIFISWNRPVVGREKEALDLWQKSMEYYGKLQADGKIESVEPVILSAHGGLNGFVVIKGDGPQLDEIRREETFINNVVKGNYCLEKFTVVDGYVGEALTDVFGRWMKTISS